MTPNEFEKQTSRIKKYQELEREILVAKETLKTIDKTNGLNRITVNLSTKQTCVHSMNFPVRYPLTEVKTDYLTCLKDIVEVRIAELKVEMEAL